MKVMISQPMNGRCEEDIKILEEMIENANIEDMDMNNCFGGEHIEAIEHILSDYKKLQEESKQVDHECERLEEKEVRLIKENEELKRDRNNNYQMIALAQNEALGCMQGYEDGKKLKRSAVACIVENQQYYIIKKEIEHYKKYIEKLQKENEQLKEYIAIAPNLDEMTATKYSNIQQDAYIQGRTEEQQKAEQIIYESYISKQKIKDKIERIQEEGYWLFTTDRDSDKCVEILQELLGGNNE